MIDAEMHFVEYGDNAVSSVDVAKDLGLDHKEVKELIQRFENELKQLGSLSVEWEKCYEESDGQVYIVSTEKIEFYWLNEDQELLLVMLSPNTRDAITLKYKITLRRSRWGL